MKPQEAIEILRGANKLEITVEDIAQANNTAITALEKQVPMKPEGLEWDRMSIMRFGRCECGRPVHEPQYDDANLRYCSGCGQAIDWEASR